MAKSFTPEELELLSAFFEVLGDDLALLALCPQGNGEGGRESVIP